MHTRSSSPWGRVSFYLNRRGNKWQSRGRGWRGPTPLRHTPLQPIAQHVGEGGFRFGINEHTAPVTRAIRRGSIVMVPVRRLTTGRRNGLLIAGRNKDRLKSGSDRYNQREIHREGQGEREWQRERKRNKEKCGEQLIEEECKLQIGKQIKINKYENNREC